jgi:hypothetical protein
MAPTLTRFECSGFLPVGTPENPSDEAHHRIVGARQNIPNYLFIFERMRRSMMRRVEA